MRFSKFDRTRLNVFLAFLSVLYAAFRVVKEFGGQNIQVLMDSQDYLFNATANINFDFFAYLKPAGVALVYKLLNGDEAGIVLFQVILSIVCWLTFAYIFTSQLRLTGLKFLSFPALLLLGLNQEVLAWDSRIMTESISISIMLLFISTAILLLRSRSPFIAAFFISTGVFWALIKETNNYLLLLTAAAFLLFGILLKGHKRFLLIGIIFCVVFLTNLGFSNLGGRWKFPMLNIIGQRILVEPEALAFFETHGMPVTPALMELKYAYGHTENFSFMNSAELRPFQGWFHQHGKKTYMKYLLSNFGKSLMSPIIHLRALLDPEMGLKFFSSTLWYIQIVAAFVLLTAMLILTALKGEQPAGAFHSLFVLASVYPHLFLVWTGDAMEISRHAVSARVHLGIGMCMSLFIVLQAVWLHGKDLFKIDIRAAADKITAQVDALSLVLGKGFFSAGVLLAYYFIFYDFINAPGYFEFDFRFGLKQQLGVFGALIITTLGGLILLSARRKMGRENIE